VSWHLYEPLRLAPQCHIWFFSTREPDPAVCEGICSIIYAAPRTEVKGALLRHYARYALKPFDFILELHVLRDLLMHKYGREFAAAVMENREGCVSERVRTYVYRDFFDSPIVSIPPYR
jgi:Regulator of Vps4 activity in the MVB pathway